VYRVLAMRAADCTTAQIGGLDVRAIVVDSSSVRPDEVAHVLGVHESVAPARVAIKLIAYGLADGDEESVLDFAALGATGFLFCDATFSELCDTLRNVLSGQVRCPRSVSVSLLRHFSSSSQVRARFAILRSLTPRQRQALLLRLSGKSNKLVARSMGIEVGTVKREIHDAYKNLRVHRLDDVARLINGEATLG
jgi:DNA-binding NarL/FixJ family response regulator